MKSFSFGAVPPTAGETAQAIMNFGGELVAAGAEGIHVRNAMLFAAFLQTAGVVPDEEVLAEVGYWFEQAKAFRAGNAPGSVVFQGENFRGRSRA